MKADSPLFSFDSQVDRKALRTKILLAYGASANAVEELLVYNKNVFQHEHLATLSFPLPDESHVAAWQDYAAEADGIGVLPALQRRIVQLQFPIQAGISETKPYQDATRRGLLPQDTVAGLQLRCPDLLQLKIYASLAGTIPVLIVGDRADFVALVQAFTARNEPRPVPDSMGATMIAGFNNWDRVRRYRQEWEANQAVPATEASWTAEFQRLIPKKALYQDRLMLLSQGAYSNVTAQELGLSEPEWRDLSLTIRLEHECTHYFTRRVLNSMQNNLLDELIADYRGIVAAAGAYRADWFLHFIGLEAYPQYREGGRLQNYRGKPPLSEEGFQILQILVKAAAENLEQFDHRYRDQLHSPKQQVLLLLALTTLTLEELAGVGISAIEQAFQNQQGFWNSTG